jgi:hypothetical protein
MAKKSQEVFIQEVDTAPVVVEQTADAPVVVDDKLEQMLRLSRQESAITHVMRHHLGNTSAMNVVLVKVLDALRNA